MLEDEDLLSIFGTLQKDQPPDNSTCWSCRKETKVYPCNRCHDAYYCSQECKDTDWNLTHKDSCRLSSLLQPGLFRNQVFSLLSVVPSAQAYLSQNDVLMKIAQIKEDPSTFETHMQDERIVHIAHILAGTRGDDYAPIEVQKRMQRAQQTSSITPLQQEESTAERGPRIGASRRVVAAPRQPSASRARPTPSRGLETGENKAIFDALKTGNVVSVQRILDTVGDQAVFAEDDFGYTPLHLACQMGNKAMVSLLISRGADVNMKSKAAGYTPVLLATIASSHEIVTTLAGFGADLKATDNEGNTGLEYALRNDSPELISLFLESLTTDTPPAAPAQSLFDDPMERFFSELAAPSTTTTSTTSTTTRTTTTTTPTRAAFEVKLKPGSKPAAEEKQKKKRKKKSEIASLFDDDPIPSIFDDSSDDSWDDSSSESSSSSSASWNDSSTEEDDKEPSLGSLFDEDPPLPTTTAAKTTTAAPRRLPTVTPVQAGAAEDGEEMSLGSLFDDDPPLGQSEMTQLILPVISSQTTRPPTVTTVVTTTSTTSTTILVGEEALRQRIKELEGQLVDKERVLSLKDLKIAWMEDAHLCSVCMEQSIETVLLWCGHNVLCMKCAADIHKKTKKCPICAKDIARIVKVYRS